MTKLLSNYFSPISSALFEKPFIIFVGYINFNKLLNVNVAKYLNVNFSKFIIFDIWFLMLILSDIQIKSDENKKQFEWKNYRLYRCSFEKSLCFFSIT